MTSVSLATRLQDSSVFTDAEKNIMFQILNGGYNKGNRTNKDKVGKTKSPDEYSQTPIAIMRREQYEKNKSNEEWKSKRAEYSRRSYQRRKLKKLQADTS